MERKRVLITGAAGFIGGFLRQAFADRYVVRLTDIAQIDDPRGHEVMQADIRDLDQMRRASEGMEVVVHLAADPAPNADFSDSLLPLNIVGTSVSAKPWDVALPIRACLRSPFASAPSDARKMWIRIERTASVHREKVGSASAIWCSFSSAASTLKEWTSPSCTARVASTNRNSTSRTHAMSSATNRRTARGHTDGSSSAR